MSENPQPSSGAHRAIVLILAVVLVLGSVAVIVSLLNSGGRETASPAASGDSLAASPVPEPPAITPTRADTPEGKAMQAWDVRAGNMIVPTLNFLSEDFLKDNVEEQLRACEILKGYLDLGRTVPEPPAQDVAGAFEAWVNSLEDIVSTCMDGPNGQSDEQFLGDIADLMILSDAVFGSYVTLLGDYVPLRETEEAPREPAPLPSSAP